MKHGLTALVCVGDTREDYDAGQTSQVLEIQVRALLKYVGSKALGKVVIAYEPVWSIGEGGTPATPEFVAEQHGKIATLVKDITGGSVPLLYGGSVNKDNCVALANQPGIDGLFIGRAAWAVMDYLDIVGRVLNSSGEEK